MAGSTRERRLLMKMAAELRDEFNTIANDLDVHAKGVNIARVIGGTTGIVGGVVAIAGFAFIPFTMGASAALVGVGGSIACAAGGVAAGGASIAKSIIEKKKMEGAVGKWSSFSKALVDMLKQDPERFQKLKRTLAANLGRLGLTSVEITKDIALVAAVGARAGTTAGSTASRVIAMVAGGSILLNVAFLGFSLYDIIDGSLELSQGNGSKVGSFLRDQAKILDEFAHGRGSLAKSLDGYASDEN